MLRQDIEAILKTALHSLGINDAQPSLSHPTDSNNGDYATNVALRLANEFKTSPMELAEKIAKAIPKNESIDRVEVLKPGFINIHLSPLQLLKQLKHLSQKDFTVSSFFPKKNQTVIVEYSSPNIAKPFTIGHLRSTIIGDAIANLFSVVGYEVKRDNHVGDWGTQFGKLIYAIQQWGNIKEIEASPRPVKLLVELYVKFHDEAEKNPELEDRGREKFKLLESGDKDVRALWDKCIEWSWKEFDFIYKKLNITFTENEGRGFGESHFEKDLELVVKEIEDKNLMVASQGAKIVEFKNDEFPPLMIMKKDGASLYATRDLATDKFRKGKYGDDILVINEVGAEQTLYFRQLYSLEVMLGWFKPGQRKHLGHGLYRFKDQKMSTRKGNTIWLEDVIKEAELRASKLGDNSTVVSEVAIASLKWNDLKHSPQQDVIFDWDSVLNMQGNSGPYMLYTFVRASSILRDQTLSDVSRVELLEPEESQLLRLLAKYPEVVEQAAQRYSPSDIATYLYSIAQAFNLFYQKHQVLKSEEPSKTFRLQLTAAVANILQSGLSLLGIKTVDRM